MTDRLERLLNLVIALRETRRPLLAAEIRERVAGYGQPDQEAFRRMFERDKSDLRALGVPIEMRPLDRWDDRTGYRILPSDYDLPPLGLEPEELAALALALEATGLRHDAGAGLLKLQVDAGDAGGRAARAGRTAPAIDVDLSAPYRQELMEAQLTRTPVRFAYRPLERDVEDRTVDPWALVHRRGRWYVIGYDHARRERRAYRLDRIAGPVRATGQPGAFPPPPQDVDVDDVVPPPPPGGPERAEVIATPDVAWQIARRALGPGRPVGDAEERTSYTVAVGDPETFLAWALEFGPQLEVAGPPELRAAVVERLTAAR